MLRKVISGGQTGADIAGLEVAKKFGLETSGTMPFGYKTLGGTRPEYKELYGVTAHKSSSYGPRTKSNVQNSDGTIRLAYDFQSLGEVRTLKEIVLADKPHIDVDLGEISSETVESVVQWIRDNDIEILNVAGNSETTWAGTHEAAFQFLEALFTALKED